MISLATACAGSKKPPTPFDSDWSFCRFPPAVPAGVTKGWVRLRLTVNEDGAPVWVEPIASSDPRFEAHAIHCVLREHFEPALDDQGNAVAERVTMTIHFVR